MTIQEPIARPLTARDPRLAPWRSFLLAHARVSRRLDEELRAEHDVSFAEYDALLTIAQAPGRRVRMGLLAERGPPQQERRHAARSTASSTTGSSSAAPARPTRAAPRRS